MFLLVIHGPESHIIEFLAQCPSAIQLPLKIPSNTAERHLWGYSLRLVWLLRDLVTLLPEGMGVALGSMTDLSRDHHHSSQKGRLIGPSWQKKSKHPLLLDSLLQ